MSPLSEKCLGLGDMSVYRKRKARGVILLFSLMAWFSNGCTLMRTNTPASYPLPPTV